MRKKFRIFPIIFLVFAANVTLAQPLVPEYTRLTAKNPFAGYRPPVSVAIIKFEGSVITDIRLFNTIKQSQAALKRFTFFPYNVLYSQLSLLHLSSLDPKDARVLRELKDQLGISFIVTGVALKDGFELRIVPTNGDSVYSHVYHNSLTSTALKDAAKLFTDDLQTDYVDLSDIKWIKVEGGTFRMGSKNGYSDERPVHTVRVGSFYISATEVTFDQYDAYCTATGKPFPSDSGWGRGKMPVSNVRWDAATAYCQWLSQQLHENIHLPTEAQYEYAADGGVRSHGYIFSGSNYADDVAWFVGNSRGRPHKVGERMPNDLGIYDMSGNVWEWCQDWYHRTYDGAPSTDSAWNVQDINTPYHVVRGGSWRSSSYNCRVTVRNDGTSTGWVDVAGFRLVKDIK